MNALVIAPMHNTAGINPHTGHPWKDATGAFQPDAGRFIKTHGGHIPTYFFDNYKPLAARYQDVLTAFGVVGNGLDTLVHFGHGWETGLQCGISKANCLDFVKRTKKCWQKQIRVILYSCSAGADHLKSTGETQPGPGGDGGLADTLRDAYGQEGIDADLWAHTTVGDDDENPYVRHFKTGETVGGDWVVAPGSGLWRQWGRALHAVPEKLPKGQLPVRYWFPWWSAEQLEIELARY